MRDRRRVAALALAGAVAGVALGLVVDTFAETVYRATALLHVGPAPSPREPRADAPAVPAAVLAETYAELLSQRSFLAGIAPQVGGGRLGAAALDERIEASHPEGSALVVLSAEESSAPRAQALAADVTSAFVALVQQLARQRTTQAEDELRRRLGELDAAGATDERAALLAELARTAARGVEQATSVSVAAPASVPDEPESSRRRANLAGGLLLGLVAGIGAAVLRRNRVPEPPAVHEPPPEPQRAAEPERVAEPERAAEPESASPPAQPLSVRLLEPAPRSRVSGEIALRTEAAGAATVELMASDGGLEWRPVPAVWDTRGVADGVWWLSAVARHADGREAASEPLPVVVANRSA